MWIKKYKKPLLLALLVAVALVFAFWYGGGTAGSRGWTVAPTRDKEQSQVTAPQPEENTEPSVGLAPPDTENAAVPEGEVPSVATPDVPTEQAAAPPAAPEQTPAPAPAAPPTQPPAPKQLTPPQEQVPVPQELVCTLSISCATALLQSELDAEKAALLPTNGLILAETSLSFSEGESVFDLLLRACQEAGLHLEFAKTPLYQSAYIEGIGNLYEFDCGALSGWMYQVNGSFPNYGSSRHTLQNGDVVRWVYTCDLGEDVGGGAASGQFADT